jgi:hypothetical protein
VRLVGRWVGGNKAPARPSSSQRRWCIPTAAGFGVVSSPGSSTPMVASCCLPDRGELLVKWCGVVWSSRRPSECPAVVRRGSLFGGPGVHSARVHRNHRPELQQPRGTRRGVPAELNGPNSAQPHYKRQPLRTTGLDFRHPDRV